MKIGWVGLGALGYPAAVAFSLKGHDVMGYDINPLVMSLEPRSYKELLPDGRDLNNILPISGLKFGTLEEVIDHAKLLFLCIQTPHDKKYEGNVLCPDEPRDFDYSYLVQCIKNINKIVKKETCVSIISTVLPGTIEREILPIASKLLKIVYNPFTPGQGTNISDIHFPEFYLIGRNDPDAEKMLIACYKTINPDVPILCMSIPSAEMTKMCYNTWITAKITLTQAITELSHKTAGADAGDVLGALHKATKRIVSPAYMNSGMQDSGGCHPRDLHSITFYADSLNISTNIWKYLTHAREDQMRWLVNIMIEKNIDNLPYAILGYTFKKETNKETGSSARLCQDIFRQYGINNVIMYDPYIDEEKLMFNGPYIFLIGMNHDYWKDYFFPAGSIVIDPFRYLTHLASRSDLKYIPVGIGRRDEE